MPKSPIERGPDENIELIDSLAQSYIELSSTGGATRDQIIGELEDRIIAGEISDDEAIAVSYKLGFIEE